MREPRQLPGCFGYLNSPRMADLCDCRVEIYSLIEEGSNGDEAGTPDSLPAMSHGVLAVIQQ
jgi:hypothetical protein